MELKPAVWIPNQFGIHRHCIRGYQSATKAELIEIQRLKTSPNRFIATKLMFCPKFVSGFWTLKTVWKLVLFVARFWHFPEFKHPDFGILLYFQICLGAKYKGPFTVRRWQKHDRKWDYPPPLSAVWHHSQTLMYIRHWMRLCQWEASQCASGGWVLHLDQGVDSYAHRSRKPWLKRTFRNDVTWECPTAKAPGKSNWNGRT